jgi:hypothetical protein
MSFWPAAAVTHTHTHTHTHAQCERGTSAPNESREDERRARKYGVTERRRGRTELDAVLGGDGATVDDSGLVGDGLGDLG